MGRPGGSGRGTGLLAWRCGRRRALACLGACALPSATCPSSASFHPPAPNPPPTNPPILQQIKPDFSNYDESAAWPYLLDEFVEYMKEKQK